jgi:outer membrane protein assembly factor BamE
MRPLTHLRPAFLALAALTASQLSGCAAVSDKVVSMITPYRPDIVQGNAITAEQMARVSVGKSRLQVKEALGSPLIADPFHADRWDYVFTLRRPGQELLRRAVVIRFDGDVVKSIDAPDLPTELEFVASISKAKPNPDAVERKLALTPEEIAALPVPKPQSASDKREPQGAIRSYPPLETL